MLKNDFVDVFGCSVRARLFARLFVWRDGEFKNVGLIGEIAKVVIDGVGHALKNAVLETISARAKLEPEWRLGQIEEATRDFFVKLSIFVLKRRVDIDGAAEFSALKYFFHAKRVNGDVCKHFAGFVGSHASETVGGIFE